MFFTTSADLLATVRYVCRWLALSALLGTLAGTASALFLIALDWATGTRVAHPWLLWGCRPPVSQPAGSTIASASPSRAATTC